MSAAIRSLREGDADGLGQVHVRAWQAAYRGGLMPDDYLDSLSPEERASMPGGGFLPPASRALQLRR